MVVKIKKDCCRGIICKLLWSSDKEVLLGIYLFISFFNNRVICFVFVGINWEIDGGIWYNL